MALPASGALAISQISVELGRASTATTNLNEAAVRSLAGVASGSISISNFYGKSSGFALTIASNTNNYNLRSAAVAAGWPGTTDTSVTVTLNPGVYVGSGSTGSYAFDVGSPWPAGSTVTLVNQGTVVGRGGNGGAGGRGFPGQAPTSQITTTGSAGGGGLVTTRATTITNNGKIAGGGGGGGGGGSSTHKNSIRAGGGGGGAGIGGGSGGTGGTGHYQTGHGSQNGQGSSYTAAGSGGGAGSSTSIGQTARVGGAGGAGGSYGSGGSHGGNGNHDTGDHTGPGVGTQGLSGGAAGAAVAGNPFVTYPVTGQRDGSLS
jgi:hypothetical protein